jgi:hypothetical protein
MSKDLIETVKEHNLCTFYLLPLLGINKFSFHEKNFMECFAHPEGKYLYVQVKNLENCYPDVYECRNYLGTEQTEHGYFMIWYRFPFRLWRREFDAFKRGMYSEFSERAKSKIIANSGLWWRKKVEGKKRPFTDLRLLALYRSEVLRKKWEADLKLNLGPEHELLPAPDEHTYLLKEEEP